MGEIGLIGRARRTVKPARSVLSSSRTFHLANAQKNRPEARGLRAIHQLPTPGLDAMPQDSFEILHDDGSPTQSYGVAVDVSMELQSGPVGSRRYAGAHKIHCAIGKVGRRRVAA